MRRVSRVRFVISLERSERMESDEERKIDKIQIHPRMQKHQRCTDRIVAL